MLDIANQVSKRPESHSDMMFLRELYISTRSEEVDLIASWSDEQKLQFLTQQFEAQYRFYHDQFPNATYEVILYAESLAGRLYHEERDDEIRIIDIALLPKFRNRQIGLLLMNEVMESASEKGKVVRIHVEKNNPALSFYLRLDFKPIADKGVYYLMQWKPANK